MSLNGLDDASIREAHQAAVAEPGGWFLLKYASRDELTIHGRGNGGIVEIRNNIAQFEESSPLYGFLRYRRRNVIIKYLPEDCSRLVQARASVHFNTVCDRFAPYDTTFSITNSKELKDTKLSAACSLHAASGSTSSSTSSLRRRRLMEIAEEEEEEERERKRQSVVKEEDSLAGKEDTSVAPPASPTSPASPALLTPQLTLNSELAKSPENSQFSGTRVPPEFGGIARPPSPAKSVDGATRGAASQTGRPDIYSYSSYPYSKPKVKLAPRPSLEVSGQPNTSGSTGPYRPIAALPAGFKLFSKKSKSQDKSGSSTDNTIKEEAEINFLTSSITENSEITRPHTSSGAHGSVSALSESAPSMPSLPPLAPAATSTKKNTISPEKARLMKAMKLRERKMMTAPTTPDVSTPEVLSEVPVHITEESAPAAEGPTEDLAAESDMHLDSRLSMSKADSGIDIEVSLDRASVDTPTDSHPPSPIAASSELGESTQASSLSESTDETAHPAADSKDLEATAHDDHEGDDEEEEEEEQVREKTQQPGAGLVAMELRNEAPVDHTVTELEEQRPDHNHEQELKMEQYEQEPDVEAPEEAVEEETVQKSVQEPEQHQFQDSIETTEMQPPATEAAFEPDTQPVLEPIQTKAEERAAVTKSPVLPVSKFSTASPRLAQSPWGAPSMDEPIQPGVAQPAQSPQSPQLPIPLSKFSTREAKSPVSEDPPDLPSILTPTIEPRPTTADDSAAVETEEDEDDEDDATERISVDTRRSRRKYIEPIRTDLDLPTSKTTSEANLSDDDDLLDELQSATVEEAKPIMVSKSWVPGSSPPKRAATGLDGEAPRGMVRTVSSPVRGGFLAPGDVTNTSARSVSSGAAFLHKLTQQSSASDLRPKSAKIGSSISQRIKALERLSSVVPADAERKDRPSSTFFAVRKPSTREPSRSPSVMDRTTSITRATTPSPDNSRESSPEASKFNRRDRSGSMASRLSVFEGGNLPRGRPESIQVTARIIREPGQLFPKLPELKADTAEYSSLDLKQSPLVVDHQKATPSASPAPTPAPEVQPAKPQNVPERRPSLLQRRFSKGRRSQSEDRETVKEQDTEDAEESRPRRRSSLTIVKDFIKDRRGSILSAKSMSTDNLNLMINPAAGNLASPAIPTPSQSPSRPPSVHHNSLFPRRLSISSRRSSLDQQKSPVPPPTGMSGEGLSPSLMTEGSADSEGESRSSAAGGANPTKSNRATRFMRRLSNSLNAGRKSVTPSISPTVAEEDAAEVEAAGKTIPPSRGSAMTAHYMQPTIVAYMGDVNVQFPDTLLWKRRTMCLDSHGFLILSAIQGVTVTMPAAATTVVNKDRHHQAGAIKRYHMSDFKPPYAPEIEVQELPNSVVLDFVDGSGIQIACEDRAGQLNTLHVLEDAHHSHTTFGL